MIKILAIAKRAPGTTTEQFRDYYENIHAKIGEAAFAGRAARYVRRYLRPFSHPIDGPEQHQADYDVVMEMWFEDAKAMEDAMALFVGNPLTDYVAQDEANLFDRKAIRMYIVEEEEDTDLASLPHLDLTGIHERFGIAPSLQS